MSLFTEENKYRHKVADAHQRQGTHFYRKYIQKFRNYEREFETPEDCLWFFFIVSKWKVKDIAKVLRLTERAVKYQKRKFLEKNTPRQDAEG